MGYAHDILSGRRPPLEPSAALALIDDLQADALHELADEAERARDASRRHRLRRGYDFTIGYIRAAAYDRGQS